MQAPSWRHEHLEREAQAHQGTLDFIPQVRETFHAEGIQFTGREQEVSEEKRSISYPKNGAQSPRDQSPGGKSRGDMDLQFGETVQLPGRSPTSRKYTKNYEKGENGPDADDFSAGLGGLLGPTSGPLNTR